MEQNAGKLSRLDVLLNASERRLLGRVELETQRHDPGSHIRHGKLSRFFRYLDQTTSYQSAECRTRHSETVERIDCDSPCRRGQGIQQRSLIRIQLAFCALEHRNLHGARRLARAG